MLFRSYDYVSTRVLAEDGTVMQFVGDEVYAVFGAPLDRPDHTAAALRAALAIQDDLPELDGILAAEGLPTIRFGIGLHSGPAIAAHVGTPARRQACSSRPAYAPGVRRRTAISSKATPRLASSPMRRTSSTTSRASPGADQSWKIGRAHV